MKAVLILLLALLMLIGCAPTAPTVRPEPATQDPIELSERGQHDQSAERWMALAAAAVDPEDEARAQLAAAEQWLAANRPAQAEAVLAGIGLRALDRDDRFRFELAQAELAMVNADYDTARWILDWPLTQVPDAQRDRFMALNDRLDRADPDSIRARIDRIETAMNDGTFAPSMALSLLLEYPLSSIQVAQQRAVAESNAALLPWLSLAVHAREYLLDKPARIEAFAAWEQAHLALNWTALEAEQAVQGWKAVQPRPTKLAVLLPGEGRLQRAGDIVRDGLISAWLSLPVEARPALSFYYLYDRADAAIGALFSAQDEGVDGVIGPIDRAQISALLQLPDTGLPMLWLNRPLDDGLG
ncbi:MAG: penicillin-binding protein activator, partial [Pseudomonadota bacterium]